MPPLHEPAVNFPSLLAHGFIGQQTRGAKPHPVKLHHDVSSSGEASVSLTAVVPQDVEHVVAFADIKPVHVFMLCQTSVRSVSPGRENRQKSEEAISPPLILSLPILSEGRCSAVSESVLRTPGY